MNKFAFALPATSPFLSASIYLCPLCRTALCCTWPQRSTFNWQILATASASASASATCAAGVGVHMRACVCRRVWPCVGVCMCACGWLCVTGPHNFHLPLSAAAYFIQGTAPQLLPTLAARARRNLWALLVYYYIVFSTLLRVLLLLLLSYATCVTHFVGCFVVGAVVSFAFSLQHSDLCPAPQSALVSNPNKCAHLAFVFHISRITAHSKKVLRKICRKIQYLAQSAPPPSSFTSLPSASSYSTWRLLWANFELHH